MVSKTKTAYKRYTKCYFGCKLKYYESGWYHLTNHYEKVHNVFAKTPQHNMNSESSNP